MKLYVRQYDIEKLSITSSLTACFSYQSTDVLLLALLHLLLSHLKHLKTPSPPPLLMPIPKCEFQSSHLRLNNLWDVPKCSVLLAWCYLLREAFTSVPGNCLLLFSIICFFLYPPNIPFLTVIMHFNYWISWDKVYVTNPHTNILRAVLEEHLDFRLTMQGGCELDYFSRGTPGASETSVQFQVLCAMSLLPTFYPFHNLWEELPLNYA